MSTGEGPGITDGVAVGTTREGVEWPCELSTVDDTTGGDCSVDEDSLVLRSGTCEEEDGVSMDTTSGIPSNRSLRRVEGGMD